MLEFCFLAIVDVNYLIFWNQSSPLQMKRMIRLHHLLRERGMGIMQVDQVVQAALAVTQDPLQVVIILFHIKLNY